MNKLIVLLISIVFVITCSCESENIEDKYLNDAGQDPNGTNPNLGKGEIAWFSFNGHLSDSSLNNTPVMVNGDIRYVEGLNDDHGEGLFLDGNTYLVLDIGHHDTISIAFWIKGERVLANTNTPVLFDYGFNGLMAQLEVDAFSGATTLSVKKNEYVANSNENSHVPFLNSFTKYSFVYVEAGGDKTKVYFKGYLASGIEVGYFDEYDFPGIIYSQSELLYIGRNSSPDSGDETYFKGSIDEIHVFNKPLSNAEIEAMALIPTN